MVTEKDIINTIHDSIYKFFDEYPVDGAPFTEKDKLLLKINKEICINIKDLYVTDICLHGVEKYIKLKQAQDYLMTYEGDYYTYEPSYFAAALGNLPSYTIAGVNIIKEEK